MVLRHTPIMPSNPINLILGFPSPSLLPASLVSSAAQRVLSNPATSTPALLYGKDEGYWPLRVALARWFEDFYGPARRSYASRVSSPDIRSGEKFDPEIEASKITITGGASQSLGIILSTFTDPDWTQTVWMAVPAYFLAFKIFHDAGFAGRLRAVPEDDEGIDVSFLEKALAECELRQGRKVESEKSCSGPKWKGNKPHSLYERVYRHVIYVVPTFANPSSRTMSLKRREELVRVARKHDALVVCDDVYDMLQWSRKSDASTQPDTSCLKHAQMPRLVDVDRHLSPAPDADSFGNVVSNGSFTKILGPGMRTGWVDGTPRFAHRLSQTGVQKSGGAPSQFSAVCINDLLERGELQQHVLLRLQPAYRQRWTVLREAIARHLEPLGVSIIEQLPEQGSEGLAGGYFIWIILPELLRAEQIAESAKSEENLLVAPGKMFQVPQIENDQNPDEADGPRESRGASQSVGDSTTFPRSLRLCYSWEDENLLKDGVQKLSRLISKHLDSQ